MYMVNKLVLNIFPELSDIPIKYFLILKNTFTMQKQTIRKMALSPYFLLSIKGRTDV